MCIYIYLYDMCIYIYTCIYLHIHTCLYTYVHADTCNACIHICKYI